MTATRRRSFWACFFLLPFGLLAAHESEGACPAGQYFEVPLGSTDCTCGSGVCKQGCRTYQCSSGALVGWAAGESPVCPPSYPTCNSACRTPSSQCLELAITPPMMMATASQTTVALQVQDRHAPFLVAARHKTARLCPRVQFIWSSRPIGPSIGWGRRSYFRESIAPNGGGNIPQQPP